MKNEVKQSASLLMQARAYLGGPEEPSRAEVLDAIATDDPNAGKLIALVFQQVGDKLSDYFAPPAQPQEPQPTEDS